MAKDPAQRYSSAAQLRDDLRRARSLPDSAAPASGTSRRPVGVLVAGIVALVALLAGGIAYAATRGGDEDPSADPTSSPTESTTQPTAPAGSDEQTAIANVAEAFENAGTMNAAQAQCAAEHWVQGAGLQAMIEAGLFDENLEFHDRDISEMPPEIANGVTSAALACATAS
jgi:serine/threonine-protein kinase